MKSSDPAPDMGLRFDALACQRGLHLVFEEVSGEIKSGQALALYGANGAGKTSLLRMLAGLLVPLAGNITPPPNPQEAHFLAHADGLKNLLTVDEMLRAFGGFLAAAPFDSAPLLARLGLAGRGAQKIADLSAGQRRRLSLARLIIAPRPLWLLDEPLTALDSQGRTLVDELAQAHLAAGGKIVAASHEKLSFATHELNLGNDAKAGAA